MLSIIESLTEGQRKDLFRALRDESSYVIPGVGTYAYVLDQRVNSNCYLIFSFGDKLYRMDGYYCSQEGSTWEGVGSSYEVKAVVKPVTFYERA